MTVWRTNDLEAEIAAVRDGVVELDRPASIHTSP
jgi:hypothetical protein